MRTTGPIILRNAAGEILGTVRELTFTHPTINVPLSIPTEANFQMLIPRGNWLKLRRMSRQPRWLQLRAQAKHKGRPAWRQITIPPRPKTIITITIKQHQDATKLYEGVRHGKPGAFAQIRELLRMKATAPRKR